MTKLIAPINPMPEIPYGINHPGAFGVERHLHMHTGVDLYAPHGCPVQAMEAGKIIKIDWFTGPAIDMPWWNNTRAIYIEGQHGVFNYGEVQEYPNLKKGDKVEQGDYIGYVVPVLKKYKGRPMSMLHLELYDHGYTDTWGDWKIGELKPEHLQNPTLYLLALNKSQKIDPYLNSANLYKKMISIDSPQYPLSFLSPIKAVSLCEISECDLNNKIGTCMEGLYPETCRSIKAYVRRHAERVGKT